MQIDMCVYGAAKKRKSTENGNFYFCFFCQNLETKIGGKCGGPKRKSRICALKIPTKYA